MSDGETPLYIAAKHASLNVVNRILDEKPMTVNVADLWGDINIATAARGNIYIIRSLIIENKNLNNQNSYK